MIAHHNVSLILDGDLSLETKKLLMSRCFVDIDVNYATPIPMSLSWIFPFPNNSIVLKIRDGQDADVIHRLCCPFNLLSSILLVIITLTLQNLGNKTVTLSRVTWIITT